MISCGNSSPEIGAIFSRRLSQLDPRASGRGRHQQCQGRRELTSHRSTLPSAPSPPPPSRPPPHASLSRPLAQIRAVRRKTSAREGVQRGSGNSSGAMNCVAKLAQGRRSQSERVAKRLWNLTFSARIVPWLYRALFE